MERHVTPKQVARAIGVSEASLKRWCDKGLIPFVRTAGGHRRLPLPAVAAFIRNTGQRLVDPAALGLPATSGGGTFVMERAAEQVGEALAAGDEDRVLHIAHDLFLSGRHLVDICDRVLTPALHGLGARWEHGQIEVYQERRAVELCNRLIVDFLRLLTRPADDAAHAMGSTLEGDPYSLACGMVELVLSEIGWKTETLGIGNPVSTLRAAIRSRKPRLFWITASHTVDSSKLVADLAALSDEARAADCLLVVGGRALAPNLRRELPAVAYCETLRELVDLAKSVYAFPRPAPSGAS